jgi:magnesium and cobalt transporter
MSNDDPSPRSWLQRFTQLFGNEPEDREQLLDLLRDAKQRALLDTEALSMIEGVLGVSEMRVRDIMIPRANMVVVAIDDPLDKILPVAIESAHSRFPVIGDDRSQVVGLLLAKDLLAYCGKQSNRPFDIRDLLRGAVFVPESKRLNVLLNEFRASRSHMAIVVDEFGAAAGLVTIEDVLEQIVGEIEDEHDTDERQIFKRNENEYTVKGGTAIEEFNEQFGSDFKDDEFDTIAGLITHAIGHLPKRGEKVVIGRFAFRILRADSRRVHVLDLRVLPPPDENQEEETEE